MTSWTIRQATEGDWAALAGLLTKSDLPLDGAEAHLAEFFVAVHEEDLLGSVGLERYGEASLLRSLAVASTERGQGLGQALVCQALEQAQRLGLKQVVLLTTTAADFFSRFGFHPINRADVPLSAQASIEFREACPASATVMSLTLEPEAH
jgi:N-acetylglutamate synthase-like GNAT family acetyltransferase